MERAGPSTVRPHLSPLAQQQLLLLSQGCQDGQARKGFRLTGLPEGSQTWDRSRHHYLLVVYLWTSNLMSRKEAPFLSDRSETETPGIDRVTLMSCQGTAMKVSTIPAGSHS